MPQESSSKKILKAGNFLQLVDRNGWEFVERKGISGIVTIVAVTDEAEILLVEQDRPALEARVIELPAGLAGDQPAFAGEPLENAAHRELLEETGYEAGQLTYLTQGPTSAGLCTEVITFFFASHLVQKGPGGGDENESILVHKIPISKLGEWVQEKQRQGIMVDPKVFAGLYLIPR